MDRTQFLHSCREMREPVQGAGPGPLCSRARRTPVEAAGEEMSPAPHPITPPAGDGSLFPGLHPWPFPQSPFLRDSFGPFLSVTFSRPS